MKSDQVWLVYFSIVALLLGFAIGSTSKTAELTRLKIERDLYKQTSEAWEKQTKSCLDSYAQTTKEWSDVIRERKEHVR